MKKNNLAIYITVALVVLIALLIMQKNNVLSGTKDYDDFAIEDTASISKIFIADPAGGDVTLVRGADRVWKVENKFDARKDAVNLLLKTFKQLEVYGKVSEESFETVVKNLAGHGMKVEVYLNEDKKPLKTYYIGSAISNKLGTYTLLEKNGKKSDVPYITYVTTENGSIGSRFFTNANDWRDRTVFSYDPQKIRSIEIQHFNDTTTSFKITHLGDAQFEIENLATNETFSLPTKDGISFFTSFKDVHYEYLDQKTPKNVMDSIYMTVPRTIITVVDENENSHLVKAFYMPIKEGATDSEGNRVYYNTARMYLQSKKLKLNMVAQNFVFDHLTPSFEDFELSTNVEK